LGAAQRTVGQRLCPAGPNNKMIGYVYILKSLRDGRKYIGSTVNLENRLKEHNTGLVRSTSFRRPLQIIGVRKFTTIEEAVQFEKKYKNSHGQLERDFKNGKMQYCGE